MTQWRSINYAIHSESIDIDVLCLLKYWHNHTWPQLIDGRWQQRRRWTPTIKPHFWCFSSSIALAEWMIRKSNWIASPLNKSIVINGQQNTRKLSPRSGKRIAANSRQTQQHRQRLFIESRAMTAVADNLTHGEHGLRDWNSDRLLPIRTEFNWEKWCCTCGKCQHNETKDDAAGDWKLFVYLLRYVWEQRSCIGAPVALTWNSFFSRFSSSSAPSTQ